MCTSKKERMHVSTRYWKKARRAEKWILQNLWQHSGWACLHELLLLWFLKPSLNGKYWRTLQLFRGKTGGNLSKSFEYLDNHFHFPGWKLNRSIPKSLYKTAENFLLNQLGRSCQSDKLFFILKPHKCMYSSQSSRESLGSLLQMNEADTSCWCSNMTPSSSEKMKPPKAEAKAMVWHRKDIS